MSRITITLHIDLPEGVTPIVEQAAVTPPPAAAPPSKVEGIGGDRPPIRASARVEPPPEEPPDLFSEAERVFGDDVESGRCPVHHKAWKTVPAGVSKKTGKPYAEFQACPERGCNERPRPA